MNQPPRLPRLRSRALVFAAVVMLTLVVAVLFLLPRRPALPPRLVIVSAYHSNRQEVVSFRIEPKVWEVMFAYVADASEDLAEARRRVFLTREGYIAAIGPPGKPSLRFLSLPSPALNAGKRLAQTPGLYLVDFTPTAPAQGLVVGVAKSSWSATNQWRRVKRALAQRSLGALFASQYGEPEVLRTMIFTNAETMHLEPIHVETHSKP